MDILKPVDKWNENGEAEVKLYNPNLRLWVVGKAYCAKEDEDMLSEKTGMELAEYRAEVELYKSQLKYIAIEKKILTDLLNTYKFSTRCNEEDREFQILQKKIYSLEFDRREYQELLDNAQKRITDYIDGKEEFYQMVRKLRLSREGQ